MKRITRTLLIFGIGFNIGFFIKPIWLSIIISIIFALTLNLGFIRLPKTKEVEQEAECKKTSLDTM